MARMKRGELVQLAKSLKLDLPAKETSQLIDQAVTSDDPAKFLREEAARRGLTAQESPAKHSVSKIGEGFGMQVDTTAIQKGMDQAENQLDKFTEPRADCHSAADVTLTPLDDDSEPGVIDRNDLIGFAGSLGLTADTIGDFDRVIDAALVEEDPRQMLRDLAATIFAEAKAEQAVQAAADPRCSTSHPVTVSTIAVPLCHVDDLPYKHRHLQLQMKSQHALAFTRVYRGLLAQGATLQGGKPVKSLAHAALWLIEQIDQAAPVPGQVAE